MNEFKTTSPKVLNGVSHLQNAFEQPAVLSAEQREAGVQRFFGEIEDVSLAFMIEDGVPVHRRVDSRFTVTPDYDHGVYYVDLDTGVVLTQKGIVTTRAFCALKEVFTFKVCHFWADNGWQSGSTVHMGYGRAIGDEKVGDAIFRLRVHFTEIKDRLFRLASGEMGLEEAEEDVMPDFRALGIPL